MISPVFPTPNQQYDVAQPKPEVCQCCNRPSNDLQRYKHLERCCGTCRYMGQTEPMEPVT